MSPGRRYGGMVLLHAFLAQSTDWGASRASMRRDSAPRDSALRLEIHCVVLRPAFVSAWFRPVARAAGSRPRRRRVRPASGASTCGVHGLRELRSSALCRRLAYVSGGFGADGLVASDSRILVAFASVERVKECKSRGIPLQRSRSRANRRRVRSSGYGRNLLCRRQATLRGREIKNSRAPRGARSQGSADLAATTRRRRSRAHVSSAAKAGSEGSSSVRSQ